MSNAPSRRSDGKVWEQGAWRKPGAGNTKNTRNNPRRMFVAGKYIPASHPFHRPGIFKSWDVVGVQPVERETTRQLDPHLQSMRRRLRQIYRRSDRRQSQIRDGFVYVLSHPLYPGWVKVGHSVDPERRLSSFQTATPFRDFHLLTFDYSPDRAASEGVIHRVLEMAGFEKRNEWFRCPSEVAVSAVQVQCRSACMRGGSTP